MIRDDLERRRRRVARIFTLAVLAVWIVVGIVEPPYLLPGPGDVLERLGAFVIDPHMWVHAGASLLHVVVAVAGSILIGGCLALMAYYIPVFRLAVHGRISPFLNSFSGTGWVLLAVLWFGLGDFTVVFSLAMVLIPLAPDHSAGADTVPVLDHAEQLRRVMEGAADGRALWRR